MTSKYAPEKLLKELGFSDEDLSILEAHGQSPHEVYEEVERLIDTGMTNERYARDTYEEAHP